MTREQRRGWLIVGALFVVELLVLGGVTGTMGLFLTPLMKQFGWSHSRVSMIPTAFSLAFGLGTPLVGWLMDRIDARFTMSVGAALAGLGLLIASQTSSFGIFLAAFLAVGIGTCASTFVPAAIVVANWFTDNRGFATGAAMMGSSVGGIVMPLLAAYLIAARGVSFTYEVLGGTAVAGIFGMMLMGALANRFTARRVLPFVILPLAASVIVLLGTHGPNSILWVSGYVILYGLTGGVAVSLTPVVLVEASGLRRFGSLSGLVGLVATLGTGGPLLVGALYDATSSYTLSYEVCAAAFLVSALAAIFIVPMEGVATVRVSAHGA